MNFWKALGGMVTVTLTGADPAESLQVINDRGIHLDRVELVEELTVRFRCRSDDRKAIEVLCRKRGDSLSFSGETGLTIAVNKGIRRPLLLCGFLLFLILTLFLPTRVLFIQVEGNETLPRRMILEAAEDCGIRFGSSRRLVRSEKMKNALLEAMPELKWAGINTAGCTAVISVRERILPEEQQVFTGPVSIVAARDAFVTACTVTRGNALCAPGQVVREGQVLISGYTDLGLCIQVTQAEGEVFGETRHEVQVKTPVCAVARAEITESSRRYGLILGKKRINFWKGSGISPVTCGRMYKEYYMTLPGGFRLPVCLTVESLTHWNTDETDVLPEEGELQSFARKQVLARIIAGKVLNEDFDLLQQEDGWLLEGSFLCSEMIGRVMKEKIGETNGKTD